MNIVIAYDGSNHAKTAIDDLRRAGMPRGGNALVVSVSETHLPMLSPSSLAIGGSAELHGMAATLVLAREQAAPAIQEARACACDGRRRTREHFPRWGVYADSGVGTPARTLMQMADDWRADLIVLGAYGRSAVERLPLGSVSMQVATESRCSVRVARDQAAERGGAPERIILGVDGSPGAEAAVHAVALRTWPEGTEARVIAVDTRFRRTGTIGHRRASEDWGVDGGEEQVAKALAMMERAADALREAGLTVSTDWKHGCPRDVLSEEGRTWDAGCIFVGARGFTGGPEPCAMGSTATALIARAPCSVEVIRTPRRFMAVPSVRHRSMRGRLA